MKVKPSEFNSITTSGRYYHGTGQIEQHVIMHRQGHWDDGNWDDGNWLERRFALGQVRAHPDGSAPGVCLVFGSAPDIFGAGPRHTFQLTLNSADADQLARQLIEAASPTLPFGVNKEGYLKWREWAGMNPEDRTNSAEKAEAEQSHEDAKPFGSKNGGVE